MRLAIVRTHPTQYFSPLFKALANVSGLELKVFYLFENRGRGEFDPGFNRNISWDTELLTGYEYEFVTPRPLPFKPKAVFESRCPELIEKLKSGNFDAIFCAGYGLWIDWQVIFFAIRNNIPLFCRPELNDLGVVRRGPRNWLRTRFLNWYFSKVSAFLFIGKLARDGYLSMGGEVSKAFFAPYAVNNELFQLSNFTEEKKNSLKERFGFEKCELVLLYVGRLVPRKGVDLIAQAVTQLRHKIKIGLLIVGDGPERSALESEFDAIGLEKLVFAGFQNQSKLSDYYHAADVLVVPSFVEPWGLVVNEAMASGIPVVASDRVGSAYDLIEPEKTGYIFKAGDSFSLAKKIEQVFEMKQGLGFSRSYIQRKVSNYSIQEAVRGFSAAMKYVSSESS
ncbi:MAG: glycosyltransferase [Proteobacteria bacterium]|nr:glycosyltransferase [Pseudomonadota bacterium]